MAEGKTRRKAPEFSLPDDKGKIRTLGEFTEKGPCLVVFYPGDFTPVCTKQLCNYRDALPNFSEYGVQVVGISKNDSESHARFKQQYGFTFPLLTDKANQVARDFGCVSKLLLGLVSRGIFLVDTKGFIVYEHVEMTPITRRKSDELLDVIKEFKASQAL